MTEIPSHAHRFADELDTLVRLLAEGPHRLPDQKAALRAMIQRVAVGDVTILAPGDELVVNGVRAYGMASDPAGLAGRLAAHGVARIDAARGAEAADLLAAARALATAPGRGRPPVLLGLRTVTISDTLARDGDAPAAIVSLESLGEAMLTPIYTPAVADVVPAQAPTPRETAWVAPARGAAAEEGVLPAGAATNALLGELPGSERDLDDESLARRVGEAEGVAALKPLLDEVASRAAAAAREGDALRAHRLLVAVVRRESDSTAHDVRLTLALALRDLLSVTHLRLVSSLLPRHREEREELLTLLARAGEEGADVVIEHLVESQSSSDRRVYFNTLLRLQSGVGALTHMLGDPRWYVVRNAAELLGELGPAAAEPELVGALAHEDERVRRAVVAALGRLDSTRVCHALRDALGDPDAGVRAQAAAALAGTGWSYASPILCRALGEEEDASVQAAIVAALGRTATDDAVNALAELARAPRGLFRRRGSPLRGVAVEALGHAGTARAGGAAAAHRRPGRRDPRRRRAVARRGLAAGRRSRGDHGCNCNFILTGLTGFGGLGGKGSDDTGGCRKDAVAVPASPAQSTKSR